MHLLQPPAAQGEINRANTSDETRFRLRSGKDSEASSQVTANQSMGRVSQGDEDDDEATKNGWGRERNCVGCLIVIRLPRPRGLSLGLGIGERGEKYKFIKPAKKHLCFAGNSFLGFFRESESSCHTDFFPPLISYSSCVYEVVGSVLSKLANSFRRRSD